MELYEGAYSITSQTSRAYAKTRSHRHGSNALCSSEFTESDNTSK